MLPIVDSPQGAYLKIKGNKYLNLCSNNYLGLASDSALKKAAIQAIKKYGVGTSSVRALIGTNTLHVTLEKQLARFKHAEDALVLTGGYLANMAVIQTFLDKEDVILSDELNHASIIDAIRLSGVQNKFIFKHANVKSLYEQEKQIVDLLQKPKSNKEKRKCLLVTDGVFSMDGDIAPLPDLVKFVKKINAMLMVDDAHGEGVLGSHGRGVVDYYKLHNQIDFEVGTLSKAFGVLGGFITGTKENIEFMRKNARQFLFTNGLSIPDTAALSAAVNELSRSQKRLIKLWKNARYLQAKLKQHGFDTGTTQTPITPIMIGDEKLTQDIAMKLRTYKIIISAIVFPMVPKGKARLRIMPSSLHEKKDIDIFISALIKIIKH